jgi:hypothetical protein
MRRAPASPGPRWSVRRPRRRFPLGAAAAGGARRKPGADPPGEAATTDATRGVDRSTRTGLSSTAAIEEFQRRDCDRPRLLSWPGGHLTSPRSRVSSCAELEHVAARVLASKRRYRASSDRRVDSRVCVGGSSRLLMRAGGRGRGWCPSGGRDCRFRAGDAPLTVKCASPAAIMKRSSWWGWRCSVIAPPGMLRQLKRTRSSSPSWPVAVTRIRSPVAGLENSRDRSVSLIVSPQAIRLAGRRRDRCSDHARPRSHGPARRRPHLRTRRSLPRSARRRASGRAGRRSRSDAQRTCAPARPRLRSARPRGSLPGRGDARSGARPCCRASEDRRATTDRPPPPGSPASLGRAPSTKPRPSRTLEGAPNGSARARARKTLPAA